MLFCIVVVCLIAIVSLFIAGMCAMSDNDAIILFLLIALFFGVIGVGAFIEYHKAFGNKEPVVIKAEKPIEAK